MQLHALECMPLQQERMLVCDQAAARSGAPCSLPRHMGMGCRLASP
jgi:hypothetical protein